MSAKRSKKFDVEPLGERLATIIRDRNLVQNQVDERAGVGQGTIGRVMKGLRPEISFVVIAKYAQTLGVSLDWLAWGDEKFAPDQMSAIGLDVPYVSFLSRVRRLPGLEAWLESAQGARLPLHVVARGVSTFLESPPQLKPDGSPSIGWAAFFDSFVDGEMKPKRTRKRG